jgi:FKBP-type peptidyl-prolyl cis-trans isomerase FkpA
MMKRLLALVMIVGVLLAGCGKKDSSTCTNADPASEEATIQAFNTAQGYTAVKHSSGMYYQIITPGTGVIPTQNSIVTVQYTGKLFDGTVFDSNTSASGVQFPLYNLITGWQIGIPLIRVGGTIRLMVPSAYAYGCQGSPPTIPANKPLFFEIKLLAVN